MFLKLNSGAILGLDCVSVEVEVDITKGQSAFTIVGLADTSIKEAKDRIHSALKNSGFSYPFNFRILVNLAPAALNKEGPSYDLPMALGIIALSNNLHIDLSDALVAGELGLDGTVRHINGVLPLALYAKTKGFTRLFVPEVDASEAALVEDLVVYPIKTLRHLLSHLTEESPITPFKRVPHTHNPTQDYALDMAFIKGQSFAKRALEIAASGNHNILMSGPPGAGKTLLARTLPSILPHISSEEALEVTKIYSVAGLLSQGLISERPFRAPHHTASGVALVGGGRLPRPGEISLAHRGVLFLDEFPEFPRYVIENLRQPLEDGTITISRAQGTLSFPARFILVASQNPCPCGFLSDQEHPCTCSAAQVGRYQKKMSGPILDRIDLHVEVPRLSFEKLSTTELSEPSSHIRARVEAAREIQHTRFRQLSIFTNSEMGTKELREFCPLDEQSYELLKIATSQLHLSARGFNRILKLSRTIADLAGEEAISSSHIAEALQFRTKEV